MQTPLAVLGILRWAQIRPVSPNCIHGPLGRDHQVEHGILESIKRLDREPVGDFLETMRAIGHGGLLTHTAAPAASGLGRCDSPGSAAADQGRQSAYSGGS